MRLFVITCIVLISTNLRSQENYSHNIFGRKVSIGVNSDIFGPLNLGDDRSYLLKRKVTILTDVILSRTCSFEFKYGLEKAAVEKVNTSNFNRTEYGLENIQLWDLGFRFYRNRKFSATVSNGRYFTIGGSIITRKNGMEFQSNYSINDSTLKVGSLTFNTKHLNLYFGIGRERMLGKHLTVFYEGIASVPLTNLSHTSNQEIGDLKLTSQEEEKHLADSRRNYQTNSWLDINLGIKYYLF